ncbi:response regulator [Methylobacterium sp. P31]
MAAVLVADGLPGAHQTAVNILKILDYQVFDAYNGPESLKLLQTYPEIQVLFTDLRMPGMDGMELAETARRRWPRSQGGADLRLCRPGGVAERHGFRS